MKGFQDQSFEPGRPLDIKPTIFLNAVLFLRQFEVKGCERQTTLLLSYVGHRTKKKLQYITEDLIKNSFRSGRLNTRHLQLYNIFLSTLYSHIIDWRNVVFYSLPNLLNNDQKHLLCSTVFLTSWITIRSISSLYLNTTLLFTIPAPYDRRDLQILARKLRAWTLSTTLRLVAAQKNERNAFIRYGWRWRRNGINYVEAAISVN